MIKIGVVNIDTSHPLSFSKILGAGGRAQYTAIFNDGFREDDEIEGFMKTVGIKHRLASIDEMADLVDIGFLHGCNWDKRIDQAMPFIRRGKPVFIDKPVAGSLADCDRLEKLAAEGAVILGSSSVRYADEIVEYMAKPASERGDVIHAYGTAGVDEFSYAVHIVEALSAILGMGAESCMYCGKAGAGENIMETYYVTYENGCGATYTTCSGTWQPFELVMMTSQTTCSFRIDTNHIYKALLDRICDYMETGLNKLAPVSELVESVKIMLAGKVSRDNGGKRIKLSELHDHMPGFDGDAYEAEYSRAASKIYLSD